MGKINEETKIKLLDACLDFYNENLHIQEQKEKLSENINITKEFEIFEYEMKRDRLDRNYGELTTDFVEKVKNILDDFANEEYLQSDEYKQLKLKKGIPECFKEFIPEEEATEEDKIELKSKISSENLRKTDIESLK